MPVLRWLYRNVFNSVPFGIAVLVSIALYVAVGSGFVGLRERLEMDEMLFFNWWPLKLLAATLIINLSVVTVSRIPLTPPRYGVWTIHMGIILLVLSMSAYYTRKVEGYLPLAKGQTATDFYDRWERALYVRTQFSTSRGTVLSGLPRFHEYDEPFGNASKLDQDSLRDLRPVMTVIEQGTGQRSRVTLGESLGLDRDRPVRLDVVGYYPYGQAERWKTDPAAKGTALKIRRADSNDPSQSMWLVAGRAADAVVPIGPAAIEYRHLPTQADIDIATKSAEQIHTLTIKLNGTEKAERVEPGETLELPGYSVTVEGFTPSFTLSSNDGKRADMLTLLITKAGGKPFRRTVLSESNQQTDFEIGAEGAGPFGKRLPPGKLIDADLQLGYRFSDPTKLLSTVADTTVKYVLYTADDTTGITMLRVSSREPSVVNKAAEQVDLHVTAPPAMFAPPAADGHNHEDVADLNVTRVDHVAPSDSVVAVPKEKRDRETASTGRGQVVRVKVTCGDWSQIVPVPYDPFATQNTWTSPRIAIPGATGDFQLMLGNQLRSLPIDVRLEKFEAIPYAGGDASGRSVMRDFKSTITLIPRETRDGRDGGVPFQSSASMNEPAFFKLPPLAWFVPGESWLLSQASWDPSNLDSTVLQVGNRPAVGTMIAACLMIFAGLMYAFYAKPLIVRRMKQNALKLAAERKNELKARPTNEKQLVESV